MERTAESQLRGPRTRADKVGSVVEDLLSGGVRDVPGEIAQLRDALVNRATIDQAKGMLMARYGVDADAAFRILQRWSSVSNVQLRVIAELLVDIGVNGLSTDSLSARGVEDRVLGEQLRSFVQRPGSQQSTVRPSTISGSDAASAPASRREACR